MRRMLPFMLMMLAVQSTYAVDFVKLSRNEPVTTTYEADAKCYVDVALYLNTADRTTGNIFFRVTYIIDGDTLNDNIMADENYNGVIKQLFLDQGERLTAVLTLNNNEESDIEGVQGSFRIVRQTDAGQSLDVGKNTFVGNVWRADQTPLFRIHEEDSVPQTFRLTIDLNENFEYDSLFFKLKVISPVDGILMLDKQVAVSESAILDLRRKKFSIDIEEVNISRPGSYYFQVIQNMAGKRINGVEKVSYKLLLQ